MKLHFANFDYRPDTLLADSAPAITKGFTLGFGYRPRWRTICWVHALRKFDNKYSSVITESANKVKARADLICYWKNGRKSKQFQIVSLISLNSGVLKLLRTGLKGIIHYGLYLLITMA